MFSSPLSNNFAQKPLEEVQSKLIQKTNDIQNDKSMDISKKEELLLQIKAESNNDKEILLSSDLLMEIYLSQDRNKEAIDLGNWLKKKYGNKNDTEGYLSGIYRKNALAFGNLGIINESSADFKIAIEKANAIADADKKNYQLALCYENMTVNFFNKRFEVAAFRDSAVNYYLKSNKTLEKIKKYGNIPENLKYSAIAFNDIRLAINYLEQPEEKQNLDTAERYLLSAMQIHENEKYHISIEHQVLLLNQMSWLYMEKEDYEKSIDFAFRAMKLNKKNYSPYNEVESFEFLSSSYTALGDEEKSAFYLKKYTYLKDSLAIANKSNVDAVINDKVKSMNEQQTEWKKDLLLYTGSILLFLAGITFYLWRKRNRKFRQDFEKLLAKLEAQETTLKNDFNEDERHIEQTTDSSVENFEKSKTANTMTDETKKELLKKLKNFERSKKYLSKDMNRSWLSNHLNTNPKYLTEIIYQQHQLNFNAYINHLRIDYITQCLYNDPKYREYKISYLAEECGYASPQVFVNSFKKETGVTPSYFIDNIKKSLDSKE